MMSHTVKYMLAILELLLIFIGLPLIYKLSLIPFHKSIPLLSVFIIYLVVLLTNKSFSNRIFSLNGFKNWKPIFIRFSIFAVIITILVAIFKTDSLFNIPRERPLVWLYILIGYPIWSAFPQELIFRSYFFHRFRFMITNQHLFILFNAILFSYSHIIFTNWIALSFTFLGSILFAYTYIKSNSLLVTFIEHALYGSYIFTVGLGEYFYLPMNN